MELATNIVNLLKSIGNSNFSDDLFNKLAKKVFESFNFDENETLKIDFIQPDELKQTSSANLKEITSSLYTFITELAKHDYDLNSVSSYLEELGFSEEKIKIFQDFYNEKKTLIRMFLINVSFSNFHAVDIKWKFEYCLKEDNVDRLNELNYIIDLILEVPGKEDLSVLQFSCTIEKLQDLVYKLKEAVKSLERWAQIKD